MFGTTCQKRKTRKGPSGRYRRELEKEKLIGAVHEEQSDNQIEQNFKQFLTFLLLSSQEQC